MQWKKYLETSSLFRASPKIPCESNWSTGQEEWSRTKCLLHYHADSPRRRNAFAISLTQATSLSGCLRAYPFIGPRLQRWMQRSATLRCAARQSMFPACDGARPSRNSVLFPVSRDSGKDLVMIVGDRSMQVPKNSAMSDISRQHN